MLSDYTACGNCIVLLEPRHAFQSGCGSLRRSSTLLINNDSETSDLRLELKGRAVIRPSVIKISEILHYPVRGKCNSNTDEYLSLIHI